MSANAATEFDPKNALSIAAAPVAASAEHASSPWQKSRVLSRRNRWPSWLRRNAAVLGRTASFSGAEMGDEGWRARGTVATGC